MANASKNKGDRYERLAVPYLVGLLGDLALPNAMRKLGAGRKEDTGDLYVLADTAVQVKAWSDLTAAVRSSALGAEQQAMNGGLPYHVGMSWVPRARAATQVAWVFATTVWSGDPVAVYGTTSAAVGHLRDDALGPRGERVVRVSRKGDRDLFLMPGEAWCDAYRENRLVALV